MNDTGNILVVDDEASIRAAVRRLLETDGHTVKEAASGVEAVEMATSAPFSCIILDLKMPGMDGGETFNRLREEKIDTPIVILTGHGDVPTAVDFLRKGAVDFIQKPPSTERLRIAVHNALRTKYLTDEVSQTRDMDRLRYQLVGSSGAMKHLLSILSTAAPTTAPVLITGESGTGKELAARALHHLSQVRRETFIRVNCAAIPEELIESELFGHEKGAFTGASSRKLGKFTLADGGSIFLDEIGDMSPRAQAKVLRVLESGELEPLGSGKVIKVRVRLIAATNKDLEKAMKQGDFREDLYFRLNVVPVFIPPLREHPDDIDELVEHFIRLFALENNLPVKTFTKDVLDNLKHRPWPGNIRELKNFVERCLILIPGETIQVSDLPESTETGEVPRPVSTLTWKEFRKQSEREYLLSQLKRHNWNIAATARAVQIPRSHLYRLIQTYHIERED